MYLALTQHIRRQLLLLIAAACVVLIAACGSDSSENTVATTDPVTTAAEADEDHESDGDHDDDSDHDADDGDHDDDDHDEDHDDDSDHGDDDSGDEDHDDEDHGESGADDHDESGDNDHDDDDHDDDDHDDDDHDDNDHDDNDHDDNDHDDNDHDDDDHDDDDHDDDGATGGLDAHLHGSAELFVAWSGSDVVVDLISPAINIFGFEYEPTTDEDLAIVTERTQVLTAPDLLAFNDQAGCSLVSDADSEFTVEGSHAEVTASWLFTCDEPDELSELDLTALFADFPGFEDIDVQWASQSGQSAAELSPSSTVLRFE